MYTASNTFFYGTSCIVQILSTDDYAKNNRYEKDVSREYRRPRRLHIAHSFYIILKMPNKTSSVEGRI